MIRLIYVSTAGQYLSEQDLGALLEKAQERNARQNVTGMLLYAGGNFIQVLEGEEKDVEDIYSSIAKDKRNKGHIVMKKESITERNFPEWAMGFKHLQKEGDDKISGYSEFLNREMDPAEIVKNSDAVVNLLYDFKKNNYA
jgi:hypothetical protein